MIEHPLQIVGELGQTELGPNLLQAAQQDRSFKSVHKRTLCNLSDWPTAKIEGLRGVRGRTEIALKVGEVLNTHKLGAESEQDAVDMEAAEAVQTPVPLFLSSTLANHEGRRHKMHIPGWRPSPSQSNATNPIHENNLRSIHLSGLSRSRLPIQKKSIRKNRFWLGP